MSRGRYPRRINLKQVDHAILDRYLFVWNPADLHFKPEIFPLLDSQSLFGSAAPLSLEVGCGTGEFLCELARRNPDETFLGLDNTYKPLVRSAQRASNLALDNIIFLQADVRQASARIPDETFKAIHIQFPVPGSSAQNHRPRIFDKAFMLELVRVLEVGGRLSVITDQEGAYEEMLTLADQAPRFRRVDISDFEHEIDEELRSHNYAIWIGRGHTPYRFEYVKSEAVSAETRRS